MSELQSVTSETETTVTVRRRAYNSTVNASKAIGKVVIVREYLEKSESQPQAPEKKEEVIIAPNKPKEIIITPRKPKEEIIITPNKPKEEIIITPNKPKEIIITPRSSKPPVVVAAPIEIPEPSKIDKILEESLGEVNLENETPKEESSNIPLQTNQSPVVEGDSTSARNNSWVKPGLLTRFTLRSKKYSVQRKTFVSPGTGKKRWSVDVTPSGKRSHPDTCGESQDETDTASNASEPVYSYGSLGRRRNTFQVRNESFEEIPKRKSSFTYLVGDVNSANGSESRWPNNERRDSQTTEEEFGAELTNQQGGKYKIPKAKRETFKVGDKARDSTDLRFPNFLDNYRIQSMTDTKFQQPIAADISGNIKTPSLVDQVNGSTGKQFPIAGAKYVQINNRQYGVITHGGRQRFITYLESERSNKENGQPAVLTLCDSRPWFCEKYMPADDS